MHLDHAPGPMTAARHCRVIFEPQNAGKSGFLKCPFIIEDMREHLPEHITAQENRPNSWVCSKFENSQGQPQWSTVLQSAGKSMLWIFMILALLNTKNP